MNSAAVPPLLRTVALTKRFGGTTALAAVSFDLHAGQIHALCGENGAGKSTLIKLLAGIHPHGSYQGRIELGGAEARFRSLRDAAAAGIAVVHQELALVDAMSVAENIFLGNEPTRCGVFVDGRTARRRAAELLARFGVPLAPGAPLSALGVGQKQLVEIVKALARQPRILVLDEPTAALAAHEVAVLLDLLRELRARGLAVLYISHRLEEVFQLADRITVLRDGAVVSSRDAGLTDPAGVVRDMVGREVGELYGTRSAPPGAAVLAVRDLGVAHAGRPRLADISFELRQGEVLGIGGLMGAGRSELLLHLYGVWGRRTAGQVLLDGAELPAGPPRAMLDAGVALVTEDRRRFGLIGGESVQFNLSLSSLRSVSRGGVVRAAQERTGAQRWYARLGVKAAGLGADVARLSGGNQQKVVLGRVLMTRPRVLMLDEPTRGIDIGAKAEIYALIEQLAADGCAVLLVSSELPELIGLSDRIIMLRDGVPSGEFTRRQASPDALMRAALAAPGSPGRMRV